MTVDLRYIRPGDRIRPALLAEAGGRPDDLTDALNALIARDSRVVLGAGVYPVRPLAMQQKRTLAGEGPDTRLVNLGPAGSWLLDAPGIHACRVEALSIEAGTPADTTCPPTGVPALYDPAGTNGIRLSGSFQWKINDVLFRGLSAGMQFSENAGDTKLRDVEFNQCRVAIDNRTMMNYLEGGIVSGCLWGIVGTAYSGFNWQQCTFSGDATKGLAFAHVAATAGTESYSDAQNWYENCRHIVWCAPPTGPNGAGQGQFAALSLSQSRLNCDLVAGGDGSSLLDLRGSASVSLVDCTLSGAGGPALVRTDPNTTLTATGAVCLSPVDWQLAGAHELTGFNVVQPNPVQPTQTPATQA